MSGTEHTEQVESAVPDAAPSRPAHSTRRPSKSTPGRGVAPPLDAFVQRTQATTLDDSSRVRRTQIGPPSTRQDERTGRVQRSPQLDTSAGPSVARVQGGADVVQRDLIDMASGAASAVGSGVRSFGRAVGNKLASGAKSVGNVAKKIHRSDFNELNATQYLVSAGGNVEAIDRRVEEGRVVYYKTGSVATGNGDKPTVTPYAAAIPMPDGWLPSVTHINGMMVKPNSGIGSAIRLQQELEQATGDVLLAADVPSVLYTYSAHRGFVTDLAECVWGKLYQDDDATDRQEQIMLDAVANKSRTTVSAHSRGTIKTDNAVRNAHKQLSRQYLDVAMNDPSVIQQATEAAETAAEMNAEMGISASMLIPTYIRLFARERADKRATDEMDAYVQLIYAGNAVQFPSNSVNLNLVVAGSDPVTISVGKYFRVAAGSKTKMTDVEGGHGFNASYAATVASLIIADIEATGGR